MKRKLFFVYIVFVVAFLNGCRKWVDVDLPPDQIDAASVFSTDQKALAAVSAVYAQIVNGSGQHLANRLLTVSVGYCSDELTHYAPNSTAQAFLDNELESENGLVRLIWSSAFETIYHANICIEGIRESKHLSENIAKTLIGEMQFVRAWQYFYLYQLYGEIPLITGTNYQVNALAARADSVSIFTQILSDAEAAASVLSKEFDQNERVRPTYWAAKALLARIYLFQKKWVDAASAASDILNNSLYSTLPSVETTFLKNSSDAIWQLKPVTGRLVISSDLQATSVPRVILTPHLVQEIDRSDLRWKWIDSVDRSGIRYYWPAKYRNRTTDITEYFMIFRAAEQWLIRSEARAEMGDWSGATNDINVVRGRAGLADYPLIEDRELLLENIWKERFKELWAEHADRWLTLKRTRQALNKLQSIKPQLEVHDLLFPIPSVDLLTNPNLTQNPGY